MVNSLCHIRQELNLSVSVSFSVNGDTLRCMLIHSFSTVIFVEVSVSKWVFFLTSGI